MTGVFFLYEQCGNKCESTVKLAAFCRGTHLHSCVPRKCTRNIAMELVSAAQVVDSCRVFGLSFVFVWRDRRLQCRGSDAGRRLSVGAFRSSEPLGNNGGRADGVIVNDICRWSMLAKGQAMGPGPPRETDGAEKCLWSLNCARWLARLVGRHNWVAVESTGLDVSAQCLRRARCHSRRTPRRACALWRPATVTLY